MKIYKMLADEYPELKLIADGFVPDPRTSVAVVAIEAGHYVGRVFLMSPVHIEGPWVREDKRNIGLGTKLMERAELEAKKLGISSLFAYGADDYLESQLRRLGYVKQRLTVWKKEI
jgi:predicted N-acetyltransferase YhbS